MVGGRPVVGPVVRPRDASPPGGPVSRRGGFAPQARAPRLGGTFAAAGRPDSRPPWAARGRHGPDELPQATWYSETSVTKDTEGDSTPKTSAESSETSDAPAGTAKGKASDDDAGHSDAAAGPDDEAPGEASDDERDAAGEVDLEEAARDIGWDDGVDEDALDLDELDAMGVDGVVERLRGGKSTPEDDAEDITAAGILKKQRPPRSPVVSLVVLAVAGYLLATMWGDFRYWLSSGEAEDLGDAADLVASGRLASEDFHDRYVIVRGTPDVQNAARLSTKSSYVGYRRITEAEGRLFAAIPRDKDDTQVNTFEGKFEGRMVRLGSDRAFPWLETFFDQQELTTPVTVDAQGLLAAVADAPGGPFTVPTDDGQAELGSGQNVRVVVDTPDVRLQLGRSSFNSKSSAAAVAELGYPFVQLEPTETFHRFVARIPERERDGVVERLNEGLDLTGAATDPKVGALMLPLRATYVAVAGELRRSKSGGLALPYGENTTSPGYEVEGEALTPIDLGERPVLDIPGDAVRAIRYERPIEIDPDGYLIVQGADPSSERMAGILWLVVLGLAGMNVFSLVVWLRARGE